MSMGDYLDSCPAASLDGYVLLDAQDWMNDADLTALWEKITRTARPGARVIFRTAADDRLLPGRVPDETLERWSEPLKAAPPRSDEARPLLDLRPAFHLYTLKVPQ